ncbi:MAG: DUF424 family protein [Candidatus Diapherotrites archaeon]|nr:DUF424 family protein [Candidatus Diapherotrites archaeon]
MQFYVRVVRAEGQVLLSACDSHLLGKVFREGNAVLNVSESYYGQRLVGEEELRSLLLQATIINLVGDGAVAVAEKADLCRKTDAKTVSGVPHLNIYYI